MSDELPERLDEPNDLLAEVERLRAMLAAARAYVDDPGNWSAYDNRRWHLLDLLTR